MILEFITKPTKCGDCKYLMIDTSHKQYTTIPSKVTVSCILVRVTDIKILQKRAEQLHYSFKWTD